MLGTIGQLGVPKLKSALRSLQCSTIGEKPVLQRRLKTEMNKQLIEIAEQHRKTRPRSPMLQRKPLSAIEERIVTDLPDYVCVCDFEATCQEAVRDFPFEIIEFPVVLINCSTMMIEAQFESFVRPVANPILSEFCTTLTSITQADVDGAETFDVVLQRVISWLESRGLGTVHSFIFATDGPWDLRDFFTISCSIHGIERPEFTREWIDLRKLFAGHYGKRENVEGMLSLLGLTFEGRAHRGIDDTVNIARIARQLFLDGAPIKANDGIKAHNVDDKMYTLETARRDEFQRK